MGTVNTRMWWPAFMVDEVLPRPEETPTAWLREALGDIWLVAERAEDRMDEESIREEIAPGDTMDFLYCDRLQPIAIEIGEDGSLLSHGADAEGANRFSVVGEPDMSADSLAELAELLKEEGETGTFEISCWRWSDEIPCRLEIDSGGARFVPLADVPRFADVVDQPRTGDLFNTERGS